MRIAYTIYTAKIEGKDIERERESTLVGSFVSQAVSHERMNNDNNGKETEGESPSPLTPVVSLTGCLVHILFFSL